MAVKSSQPNCTGMAPGASGERVRVKGAKRVNSEGQPRQASVLFLQTATATVVNANQIYTP